MRIYILFPVIACVAAVVTCCLGAPAPPPEQPKELATFTGHKDCVQWIAFSPDGKTLASAGRDHTVKLWEVATGRNLATLEGHTQPVYAVAFSPDGKTLASGADSNDSVRLWDVATGKNTAALSGRFGRVIALVFSPDGKTLALANLMRDVELWDLETKTKRATVELQCGEDPHSLACTSEGRVLAIGGRGPEVWDVTAGKKLVTLEPPEGGMDRVAFSPDRKTLACISDNNMVRLWDVATGKNTAAFKQPLDQIDAVTFSPSGKLLALGAKQHMPNSPELVRLIEVSSGKEVATFTKPRGRYPPGVFCLAFSPDGRILASASADWTIKLWRLPAALPADK